MRKICIVTGTRAEYGLLYWLMKEIQKDTKELQLQIVVTGMHLSPEFGLTFRQIENDGFHIDEKIEMLLSSDTPVGIAKSMGLALLGFADALKRLKPDVIVVLGDRFEILAAAEAAMVAKIPIAHIHGGELTEGAFDDAIRHALTKMAQIHFVAAETYRKRVIQMGESPDRVFNVGAPGLDHLDKITWLEKSELEDELQMRLNSPIFLITYHPVTLEKRDSKEIMDKLLLALNDFPEATKIFTYPNADTDGRVLIELIENYVVKKRPVSAAFISLGQQKYLSVMRLADVIIGNSSSGLTEAPALKKASVNIGERQKGRLRADSVIDCGEESVQITSAIRKALSAEHKDSLVQTVSVYGSGNVSFKIKEVIKNVPLEIKKHFFDISHAY